MKKTYYDLSSKDVLKILGVTNEGISSREARVRQEKDGFNELPKAKEKGVLKILFEEICEPIVIILLFTVSISFFSGEYVDAFVILFIISIDLFMGLYQELKARKNALSLQNMLKIKTIVYRDGKELQIDAREIVVGDIVFLASGDRVSADLRIIEVDDLLMDESLLTGESMGVLKTDNKISKKETFYANMAYAGTTVLSGRGKGVVVNIGIDTELGCITKTVNEVEEEKSPLEMRMNKFTGQISLVILFISFVLAVVLLFKGNSFGDIFLVIVALAVSAMPEGLPLAKSMALTIGSNRMLKKNVLVKNLNAVEGLGSCTVIASDKTGTLTKNEQTAKKIVLPNGDEVTISGSGYNDEGKLDKIDENILRIVENGFINNEAVLDYVEDSWHFLGDYIDVAFKFLAKKAQLKEDDVGQVLKMIPYETENKFSAVFYEKDGKYFCTAKGSPEKILEFCGTMENKTSKKVKIKKEDILEQNNDLAQNGYRVIAVASKEIEKKKAFGLSDLENLNFDGLVGFIDPIREESKDALLTCKKAGIKVLMITGDHVLTASSIAKELGLIKSDKEIATKEEIDSFKDKNSQEFDKFVKEKKVFARVTSMDKYYIVESLKRLGEFVAVTGDGVNDAPALKTANIGIAMGSGTDVSRDVAKLILMDDNFLSIVEGIKEGRNAYENIRKICYFLLSCGLAEVLFFLLAIVFNLPMPLVALQLLWLNVVTDGLQDMALSFETSSDEVMLEKPRNPKESLFNKKMIREICLSGGYITFLVFGLWVFLVKYKAMDLLVARAYVMCLMVFIQNVHVFNCRSENCSIFKYKSKNIFVLVAVLSSIGLQFLVMEVPFLRNVLQISCLALREILVLLLLSFSVIGVLEVYKLICKNFKKSN